MGPSRTGKTEYAKSLFTNPLELKVGKLEQMPDGMRAFSRKLHDGIVLDDIRAFSFLVQHQEKLQSKYDARLEALEAGGRAVEIPQPRYDSFWTKSHSIVFIRHVFSHSAPTRNTRHPPSPIES